MTPRSATPDSLSASECGHLQFVLEYLTLRFEPEAFRELASLLATAQQRLDRERATGEEPVPTAVVH